MEEINNNMEEATTNMDKGNEQLEKKLESDKSSNKCLILAVIGVLAFIVFLIWIGF